VDESSAAFTGLGEIIISSIYEDSSTAQIDAHTNSLVNSVTLGMKGLIVTRSKFGMRLVYIMSASQNLVLASYGSANLESTL